MRNLSMFLFIVILLSACGSDSTVEAGFDQTLIEDPTLFVQDQNNGDILRVANLTPGSRHDEFGPETIDRAIEDLFERDDGDNLYILKQALIPTAVQFALEAGDGNPHAMIDAAWLGEIDGRIDTALNRTSYTPPAVITDADVKRVIDAGLAPLIAESVGVVPTDEITTAISMTVATYDYTIGSGNSGEERGWINENAETVIQRYQLLKTLDDNKRLDLPPGLTVNDVLDGKGPELFDITIIDNAGNPATHNNKVVFSSNWDKNLASFDTRNNLVEKTE